MIVVPWIETGIAEVSLRRVSLLRPDGSNLDLLVVRNTKSMPSAAVGRLTSMGFVPFSTQSHAVLYDPALIADLLPLFRDGKRVESREDKISVSLEETSDMFPGGVPEPRPAVRPAPPAPPVQSRPAVASPPLQASRIPVGGMRPMGGFTPLGGGLRPGAPPRPPAPPRPAAPAPVHAPVEPAGQTSSSVIPNLHATVSQKAIAQAGAASSTEGADEGDERRGLQVPYVSASKVGPSTAMVPRALGDPMRKALARVVDKVGDIDEWAADQLGWTVAQMGSYMAPEQVDAFALYVNSAEEDRDCVLADMTGQGKGRVVAAVIRWSILKGRKVLFMTEKPNLFSDIYRDIADIGSLELVGRPFVLNLDVAIEDTIDNSIVFPALDPVLVSSAIKAKRIPNEFKLVIAGYPQINEGISSAKTQFLRAVVEENRANVVLDECHNAAGDSNVSEAAEHIIDAATNVLHSSATFAKTADNLSVYKRLFPPSMRSSDLREMLRAGGRSLAEALIQMLSESGQYIRREHDLSKIPVRLVVDETRVERNRAIGNMLSPILRSVASLSRDVMEVVNRANEDAKDAKRKELWTTGTFGSRLSIIARQFTTSLLVDFCVERGLRHIEEGKKPIPFVETTMESQMRELSSGEEGAEDVLDVREGDAAPTFRDVLALLVERTLQVSVRRPKAKDPEKVKIEDPEIRATADQILAMIERFPDLPFSPIDEIIDRFADRGHSFGEVSARGMRISRGRYVPAPKIDRLKVVADFNSGRHVGMLLTKAGSTGLSAQASSKFKDQRRRVIQEVQICQDTSGRVQTHGRANRRGQIDIPEIEALSTGLPFQARNLAIQNRKLRVMSANTTGESANMGLMDVVDVIDSIGNDVAREMLENQPQLARRLHIAMKLDDPEAAASELYHVEKIGQRLIMLDADEQDKVWDELVSGYQARIEDMKARGESPTPDRSLPGEWKVVGTEVLEPGNEEDGPIFGAPANITTIETFVRTDPWSAKQVHDAVFASWVEKGVEPGTRIGDVMADQVEARRREVLRAALVGHYRTVEDALKSPKPNACKAAEEKLNKLVNLVRNIMPGHMVEIRNDDGVSTGVILDLVPPAAQGDFHKPGLWSLRYVMPGDERPRSMTLAGFMGGKVSLLVGDRGRVHQNMARRFDQAPKGQVRVVRRLIDGNLVKAALVARREGWSSIVTWKDEEGAEHKGVLVPKAAHSALASLPGRVSDPTVAAALVRASAQVWTHPDGSDTGASVEVRGRRVVLTIPGGKRARKTFETPAVTALVPSFSEDTRPVGSTSIENLDALMVALSDAGHAFHYEGAYRAMASTLAAGEEPDTPDASPPVQASRLVPA